MAASRKEVGKKAHARYASATVKKPTKQPPVLVHMNTQGRLTLPASARRSLGLEGEADFQVDLDRHAVVLRPAVVMTMEDAWAYTPGHRRLLERAHKDSREGRVRELTESQIERLAAR